MNSYLLAAAVLAVIVGFAHSVLGEVLIFRHLRNGGIIPTYGAQLLKDRHVRILWASWHLLTVFGWCLAAILWRLSQNSTFSHFDEFVARAIAGAMMISGALVLVGTNGKHPGWAGLLGVAVLTYMSVLAK